MVGEESGNVEKDTFSVISKYSKKLMPEYNTPVSDGQSNEEE